MSWTCACDTQNLDAARYCEFCGREHTPTTKPPGPSGMAWSPSTPKYTGEPWEGQTPLTPEEVAPYLAKLREIGAAHRETGAALLTPDRTAAYLAACRARGYHPEALEALGPAPEPPATADLPQVVARMTTARREFKRELAHLFPVTEAEERAAQRAEAAR